MKIVTHPGPAHFDEFISCSLLLAEHYDEIDSIQRREVTPADLENPNIWVVDQGGQHTPDLLNFDHHQDGRDDPARCSITLILDNLGYDLEVAREALPWLQFAEWIDSKGPSKTAEKFGIDPSSMPAFQNPIVGHLLKEFSASESVNINFPTLFCTMRNIGLSILETVQTFQEGLNYLEDRAGLVDVYSSKGVKVRILDATACCLPDKQSLPTESYLKMIGEEERVAVVVSQDNRGDGLALFRRNDHPSIDFSRIKDEPEVIFAHNGGFIAKTESPKDDWVNLVRKAIIE